MCEQTSQIREVNEGPSDPQVWQASADVFEPRRRPILVWKQVVTVAKSKTLFAFPITPCDDGGQVDTGALRRVLAPLVSAKVDAIGLLGSTGSYPYLTREERRRALETAVDQVSGAMPILAGIGALRTDDAVALARDAKAIGAAAGLLAPVSYTPLRDDEVFTHFVTVAEEGGLPLTIYDNPSTTHFTFSPDLLGRLSQVPGIVALKTSAPAPERVEAHLAALRASVGPSIAIGCSMDWHTAEALLAGAEAWHSVAAGLFPDLCLGLIRATETDAAEARRRNAFLEPLWDLFRRHTSLRTVFAAAEILGLSRAKPPRPILPLDPIAQAEVATTLRTLGLV